VDAGDPQAKFCRVVMETYPAKTAKKLQKREMNRVAFFLFLDPLFCHPISSRSVLCAASVSGVLNG